MFRAVFGALLVLCANTSVHAAGRVFVVSKARGSVEAFNAETGKREFEVKGQGEPHTVTLSADGLQAYIGDAGGTKNTIQMIDLATQTIGWTMTTAPYIRPHGLVLSHDGSKLYATCAPNRTVIEVDLATRKLTRHFDFSVENVENLAITPDDKLIFASSTLDGTLVVLDLAKGEIERLIRSGRDPEGLAVSPDGKEVWAANSLQQTIAVIDVATRRRVAELKCLGSPAQVRFTSDSSRAIVVMRDAGLAIFDRAKRVELKRFEVGNLPVELTLDDTDQIAYVVCTEGASVSVVDLAAHKVLRTFAVGANPEGIAYSSK
jgi:YVTN family beta-propeller protein